MPKVPTRRPVAVGPPAWGQSVPPAEATKAESVAAEEVKVFKGLFYLLNAGLQQIDVTRRAFVFSYFYV